MLKDIQKQFHASMENPNKESPHRIPRDYVVPNEQVKILGSGIKQLLFEQHQVK